MLKVLLIIYATNPAGQWHIVAKDPVDSWQHCSELAAKFADKVKSEQRAPLAVSCEAEIPHE